MVSDADGAELGPSFGFTRGAVTLRERFPGHPDDYWVMRNTTTGRIELALDLYYQGGTCNDGGGSSGFVLEDAGVSALSVFRNGSTVLAITPSQPTAKDLMSVRRSATGTCDPVALSNVRTFNSQVPSAPIPLQRPGPFTLVPSQL